MQKTIFKIEGNKGVAKDCFRMVLSSPVQTCMAPGQFVDIALEGFFLRRPISVCDCSADASGTLLTLLYKTVGDGTRAMASMHPGQTLELLAPLGNGFDLSACRGRALLVGGGIGTAPLYLLCRELLAAGREVCAVFGFNTAAEAVLLDDFRQLGTEPLVATMDGSLGTRGFVTDALLGTLSRIRLLLRLRPAPDDEGSRRLRHLGANTASRREWAAARDSATDAAAARPRA